MGTKMPKTIEEQLMGMENFQKQLKKNIWWVQKIAQNNWKTIDGYKKYPKTIELQLMGDKK